MTQSGHPTIFVNSFALCPILMSPLPIRLSGNGLNAYDDAATDRDQALDRREVLSGQRLPQFTTAVILRMLPLVRFAPGLAKLLEYKLADAPADIKAGLAVTAVALPVGIAYAGLAGFRPEVGLYSSRIAPCGLRDFRLVAPTHCRPRCGNVRRDCSRRRSPRSR